MPQYADIKPYGRNPKKHPDKQLEKLANCVREVGWRMPVLVNQEGVIIAGHGRWMTFERYGEAYSLKPIWVIDDMGNTVNGGPETTAMTAEQEAAYRLADNMLAESPWDMQMVVSILKELSLPMLDMTGFDRRLILENDDKDDQVPAMPAVARTQLGDVYLLGPHRIVCGDSTQEDIIAKLFQTVKADMVFTDPPYNIDYHGAGKNTSTGILNDSMGKAEFREFLTRAFLQMRNNIKAGASLYIFHDPSTQKEFEEALNLNSIEVKYQLIWNKPSAGLGMGDYRKKHEPFFYAAVKGTDPNFYGDRTHTTVLDFHKTDRQILEWARKQRLAEENGKTTLWTMKREPMKEYVHPTQKPVELITYALANSSKVEDIIFDPFLGSGSTLIACQKTNRVCYGAELDPKFVDIIVQRYVDFTENRNIKLNGESILW